MLNESGKMDSDDLEDDESNFDCCNRLKRKPVYVNVKKKVQDEQKTHLI